METIKYKGYIIKVIQDEDPINPRKDCDHIGKMVSFHPRYNLGDKHEYTPETLSEFVEREHGKTIHAQMLYLLDHSGLWISTAPFACDPGGWDTSRIGFIFVELEKVRSEFGLKDEAAVLQKAAEIIQAEVEEYNDYLTGNVYGFEVTDDETGEEIEACWGFFGDPEKSGVIDEAKSVVEYQLRIHGEQLSLFPEMETA